VKVPHSQAREATSTRPTRTTASTTPLVPNHTQATPNFTVKPDGTAKLTVEDAAVTLGSGSNSVFANGGTALMIHAKADDLMSDPAGNAGDRIACGVIAK